MSILFTNVHSAVGATPALTPGAVLVQGNRSKTVALQGEPMLVAMQNLLTRDALPHELRSRRMRRHDRDRNGNG